MKKKAIYPGSFDPFTLGHKAMVNKALKMFDEVIIAIGINDKKSYCFSLDHRVELIRKIYESENRVKVVAYEGLTTDYCISNGIGFIIRGVRNFLDFEFERSIAQINGRLAEDIETVLFITPPEYGDISSSVVREIMFHGGDPMQFLPPELTREDLVKVNSKKDFNL